MPAHRRPGLAGHHEDDGRGGLPRLGLREREDEGSLGLGASGGADERGDGAPVTQPDPRFFQTRPSGTDPPDNAAASSFANYGPNSTVTLAASWAEAPLRGSRMWWTSAEARRS